MLLNFLIRSQLTAKTRYSVAKAGACCEEGGIGAKVGISARAGIGAGVGIGDSSGKDAFGPSWMPLLASSVVYSGGVGE